MNLTFSRFPSHSPFPPYSFMSALVRGKTWERWLIQKFPEWAKICPIAECLACVFVFVCARGCVCIKRGRSPIKLTWIKNLTESAKLLSLINDSMHISFNSFVISLLFNPLDWRLFMFSLEDFQFQIKVLHYPSAVLRETIRINSSQLSVVVVG